MIGHNQFGFYESQWLYGCIILYDIEEARTILRSEYAVIHGFKIQELEYTLKNVL